MVTSGQPCSAPGRIPSPFVGDWGTSLIRSGWGGCCGGSRTDSKHDPGRSTRSRLDAAPCVPLSHRAGDTGRALYPTQSCIVLWVLTGVGGGVPSLRSASPRCAVSSQASSAGTGRGGPAALHSAQNRARAGRWLMWQRT